LIKPRLRLELSLSLCEMRAAVGHAAADS